MKSTGIDVAALVDDSTRPVPAVAGQSDLLEIHRQLLEMAQRGAYFVRAAAVISNLSVALDRFPGADPRTVDLVFAQVVAGLRRGALRPGAEMDRFVVAGGWLSHIYIQARAAKAHAVAE